MKYKIDVVRIRENSITLNGWVLGKNPESRATFRVEDEKHRAVKFKMVPTRRDDVSQIYFKKVYDKDFGFDIRFPYERGKSYWLLIRCEGRQAKIKFNEELIAKRGQRGSQADGEDQGPDEHGDSPGGHGFLEGAWPQGP